MQSAVTQKGKLVKASFVKIHADGTREDVGTFTNFAHLEPVPIAVKSWFQIVVEKLLVLVFGKVK